MRITISPKPALRLPPSEAVTASSTFLRITYLHPSIPQAIDFRRRHGDTALPQSPVAKAARGAFADVA
jgi:hypothetical protein